MRRLALAAAAAAVLAAAVLLAVRLLAPAATDEERVRALFDGAARALSEKRVGDAMEAVSERFRGRDLDRRGLHGLLLAHVLRGAWVAAHVSVDRVLVEGDSAEASLVAVAARGGAGATLEELLPANATALRAECRLAREGGEWRIVHAEWRRVGLEELRAGLRSPEGGGATR